MTQEFITYEQSLALKELGFDEACIGWYNPQTEMNMVTTDKYWAYHLSGEWENFVPAPLKSQVFRWFREKHRLGHMINGIGFESFIMNIGGIQVIFDSMKFKTYEEAESACIDKLIELAKSINHA